MGSRLSSVLPLRMLGTSLEGSPKGSIQLPKNEKTQRLLRWPWARSPRNHQTLCDAEEGESRAHIPTPKRPHHIPPRVEEESKAHVLTPKRPDHKPTRAEEESKAHVPAPERPRHEPPCAGAESKDHVPTPKRRALLIGITYHDSIDPMWTSLVGSHDDVDRFRELLIRVYFIHRVASGN